MADECSDIATPGSLSFLIIRAVEWIPLAILAPTCGLKTNTSL